MSINALKLKTTSHKLRLDDCLSHKALRVSQRQECTCTRTQWQALASVTTYTEYRPIVLTTITYMALHIKTIEVLWIVTVLGKSLRKLLNFP